MRSPTIGRTSDFAGKAISARAAREAKTFMFFTVQMSEVVHIAEHQDQARYGVEDDYSLRKRKDSDTVTGMKSCRFQTIFLIN